RSSGSCAILSALGGGAGAGAAFGVWAQAVGAASMPVENKTAMSSAISRFMGAPPRRVSVTANSADLEQLHLEDQRRPRRDDPARPAVAVAQVRGDDQLPLAADLHRDHALVPA